MSAFLHADWLGWLAAALMVATFGCREARCMRPLAVATNLAFMGYGLTAALWRWWECTRLNAGVASPPGTAPAGTEPWPSNCRPPLRETPR